MTYSYTIMREISSCNEIMNTWMENIKRIAEHHRESVWSNKCWMWKYQLKIPIVVQKPQIHMIENNHKNNALPLMKRLEVNLMEKWNLSSETTTGGNRDEYKSMWQLKRFYMWRSVFEALTNDFKIFKNLGKSTK